MKCLYRVNRECAHDDPNEDAMDCNLCLFGQQIDSIELLTSAVMELSFKQAEEKAIKEGYDGN